MTVCRDPRFLVLNAGWKTGLEASQRVHTQHSHRKGDQGEVEVQTESLKCCLEVFGLCLVLNIQIIPASSIRR